MNQSIEAIKRTLQQAIAGLDELPKTATAQISQPSQIAITKQQIHDEIAKMNSQELNDIVEHLQVRRHTLMRLSGTAFNVGDKVELKDKNGTKFRGIIYKKPRKSNEKNFKVKEIHDRTGKPLTTTWRCTPNFLTLLPSSTNLSEPF